MNSPVNTAAKPPRIIRGLIPKGYPGIRKTVALIARLIREGAKDFTVRQHAIRVLNESKVQAKDYLGEIRALFTWVRKNIRYTRDPHRTETLHSARRMIELRAGDCDDMTILLGALIKSVGHPVRIVITGPDARRPRLFSHVYLEANHKGSWIPLDATMHHPMGWSPNAPVREVHGIDVDGVNLSSLGCPPRPLSMFGELVGLVYRRRDAKARRRTFIHFMQSPTGLATDAAGRQLFVIGGQYRVTPRGIEG